MVNFDIFKDKTVLLTGHTGFKGSWMAIWLHMLGAKVIGYALDPISDKDNFVLSKIGEKIHADIRADINDRDTLRKTFEQYQPEIVFHLAAQPLVRLSYDCPVETYHTNVMGSIYVMEEVRRCNSTKVAVMVTTDKCYENREQIWGYRENEAMGGYDPYSSSKGAAEVAINSWRRSFMNPIKQTEHKKSIASGRAGNVIGGGDWALDRIIPDCIRAIEKGEPIEIRSPKAIRPWQHVLEPICGYMTLASKMIQEPNKYCEGWNFGPNTESIVPVWDIANMVVQNYGKGTVVDKSDPTALHEANLLALDVTKAKIELQWTPKWDIKETVEKTVEWYKNYATENIFELCVKQINEYNK